MSLMRSYIRPGLAPSFLFVFVIFWGLVSRDSYGFYEKKEGKKGKMEKLRDETTQRDSPSLLQLGEPWLKECLYHCWSGSCGIRSHPVFTPCIYQTLLLQLFLFFFFFFKHTSFYSFIFKDLFLAALGLSCVWAFSSWVTWGLLFVAVHGLLIIIASLVAEHRP